MGLYAQQKLALYWQARYGDRIGPSIKLRDLPPDIQYDFIDQAVAYAFLGAVNHFEEPDYLKNFNNDLIREETELGMDFRPCQYFELCCPNKFGELDVVAAQ